MIEEIDKDILDQKVPNTTSIWYFFIQCARPPCFYFVYIYCSDILKKEECGLLQIKL